MKTLPITTIVLCLALLAGCSQKLTWTRLDGDSPDPAKLEAAQKKCRIVSKLTGLERALEDRDQKLKNSSSDQAQTLAREEYEAIRQQVYREIDTCMTRLGYKR